MKNSTLVVSLFVPLTLVLGSCQLAKQIGELTRTDPVEVSVRYDFSEALRSRRDQNGLTVKVVTNDSVIQGFLENLMLDLGFSVRSAALDAPAQAARTEWFSLGIQQISSRSELVEGCDLVVLGYLERTDVSTGNSSRNIFELEVRGAEVGQQTLAFKAEATRRSGSMFTGNPDTDRELLGEIHEKLKPAMIEKGVCSVAVEATFKKTAGS